MSHIRDDGHLVPDHRDIDDRYDQPTPADEGFDAEYEARIAKWWRDGANTRGELRIAMAR
jgi:hypothetical protein